MTVETSDTVERLIISGTGPYTFNFRIFDEAELSVSVDTGDIDPVPLTLTSHYTVTGVDDEDGGTVTLTSDTATSYAGSTLDIRSLTTEYQPTSIRNQGAFLPEIHEDAFDRLARQVQDLRRAVSASLRYPDNGTADGQMSSRAVWTGRWVYINASGEFEPAAAINPQALSQSIIGQLYRPESAAETAASVTPVNYFEEYGVFERYGAIGDGSTDDTTAVQNAFKVGGFVGGKKGKSYKMTSAAGLIVSGTRVDLTGCTLNQTTAATPALYIGRTASSSTFVKTDKVSIVGGTLTGNVSGVGSAAYGITVVQPTDSPYVNGNGCDDVEVSGAALSGFTGGVIATAASNVRVSGCRFSGMIYHAGLGAGGYGVVLQTCFDSEVDGNYFKATSTDRHAIYISGDPARANGITNVCNGVTVTRNRVDWSGVGNVTGFEAAMAIRAPQSCVIADNKIVGGRGGIDCTSENADFYNPVITGNTIRSLLSRQAIIVSKGSSSNTTFDLVVANNSVYIDNAASSFIALENVTGFTLEGNSLGSANLLSAVSILDCNSGMIGNNLFRSTTGTPNGLVFSGTCDNININRNAFTSNFATSGEYRFLGTMTNLKYGYVRRASISWSGGTPTYTDPDNIITSAVSHANGFDVTFDGWVASIGLSNVQLLAGNSTIGEVSHRAVASQVLTIGVADFVGVSLPAASNDYSVQVSLLS